MGNNPLWQLTLVRFREFLREPEALFWVFGFPLLLAAGLGLAFRNTPAEVLSIGVVGADRGAFEQAPTLAVDPFETREDGLRALREGRIALLVERPAGGAVVYHYDDTNPEGRDARLRADLAVQRSAGRQDPVAAEDQLMRETGSRYIDFLVPGLLGMNLMGGSIWSMGFAIVDARRRKLMKRLVATPMPRHYFLGSFLISRLAMLVLEVGAFLGLAVLVFGVPIRGSLVLVAAICVLGSLAFGAIGLLLSSRPHDRSRIGPHESDDVADVDTVRRVLFVAALPRRRSADHRCATADGVERRAARDDAARRHAGADR